ncbi:MAG: hypothetical protein HC869_26435 [Rhodospirillales bacterium]|nr:hypothetical protein [Rhodospirillales bacterium]
MTTQIPKHRLRLPIWLALVLALGGMTSIMALVIGVSFYVAGFVSTSQLVDDLGRSALAQLSETIDSQLQPAADQARFLADILSRDQVDPDDITNEVVSGLIEQFPGFEELLEEKEFASSGKINTWAYGYRYQFQVGYRFGRKK